MQLNSVVFPAPTCSYTTEKLFKDLIYIPKTDSKDCKEAIPCLFIPYEKEAKILMFFHGNAEDIGIAFEILLEIRNCLKVIIDESDGLVIGMCTSHGVPRIWIVFKPVKCRQTTRRCFACL